MVLLEILGLAVKKGDLMGKGLGRLMIAYLRHLAHRIQYGTFVFIIKSESPPAPYRSRS